MYLITHVPNLAGYIQERDTEITCYFSLKRAFWELTAYQFGRIRFELQNEVSNKSQKYPKAMMRVYHLKLFASFKILKMVALGCTVFTPPK